MRLSIRDTGKFGVLVGLSAIFVDAVIAHGLFWENDPYWTYWITKTFLITTVMIAGTAFLGTGIVQGLALTAVHTAILEIYYEFLAPIGLPQEPQWLDDNHLYTTGIPVHYLAILIGYFIALWIWRRSQPSVRGDDRRSATDRRVGSGGASAAALAVSSLAAILVILVISGIVTNAILLREFPGITYFVQHLLIGFVFLYLWSAYVGMGGAGWIVGALMLSLTWACYAIYLGPTGLPEKIVYLTNHQIWSRTFPGDFVAALIGLFVAVRLLPRLSPKLAYAVPMLVLVLVLVIAPDRAEAKPRGLHASASAWGEAYRVTGPNAVDLKSVQPANGAITINVVEGGNRWSPVQAHDGVDVKAEFSAPDGRYRVIVDQAMPRHPLGKYTTWNGVALMHEMHGPTGIGTNKLPLMKPDISLYGWGKVWKDGKLISPMAPVHAMVTSKGEMPGIMLEVNSEDKLLAGAPGGYITIMWPRVNAITMPRETLRNVQIFGWIGLIGLALLFGWLAYREKDRARG
jgi:hypothetical protein